MLYKQQIHQETFFIIEIHNRSPQQNKHSRVLSQAVLVCSSAKQLSAHTKNPPNYTLYCLYLNMQDEKVLGRTTLAHPQNLVVNLAVWVGESRPYVELVIKH